VFSLLARAARLPIEATLTVLPTSAASSKARLTFFAKTRFASVALRTSFAHLSGEKTPSAIVLSTNSVFVLTHAFAVRRDCPFTAPGGAGLAFGL